MLLFHSTNFFQLALIWERKFIRTRLWTSERASKQTKGKKKLQVKEGKMRISIRNRESIGCGSLVMKLNEKHSSHTELICVYVDMNGLFLSFFFFSKVCVRYILFELPLSQHAFNVCMCVWMYNLHISDAFWAHVLHRQMMKKIFLFCVQFTTHYFPSQVKI